MEIKTKEDFERFKKHLEEKLEEKKLREKELKEKEKRVKEEKRRGFRFRR